LSHEEREERSLRGSSPDERSVLDPELGIYDEDYFRSRLSEEAHRAVSTEGTVSVILIEIEGLSGLKSFYGEDTVRDFLVDSAAFLKQCVRAVDLVCRNGSTGFGLILPGTGTNVEMIRDRIQKKVNQWLVTRMSGQGAIKFSLGWATTPDEGRGGADLIKLAMKRLAECETGLDRAA
jgi:diguanylate cyclase (GGDEF)-like protein